MNIEFNKVSKALGVLMMPFALVASVAHNVHAQAQTSQTTQSSRDELQQSVEDARQAARDGMDAAKKALRAASAEMKEKAAHAKTKAAQGKEFASQLEDSVHRLVGVSLGKAAEALEAVGPEIERAVAQVDVNEIRDTVRRAMEDADRRGEFSFRVTTSETSQKGNPYSARETREFKQTLSDGTQINRASVRLLARDGEGRTRQELRQPDGTARIYINDPVAKRAHILDPQRREACSAKFDSDAINDCVKLMRKDWQPLGFNFSAGKNGIPIMTSKDDVHINVRSGAKIIDLTDKDGAWSSRDGVYSYSASGQGAVAIAPGAIATAPATRSSRDSKITREKNTQTYEGLKVDIDRTVETIPAGAFGNNRPIETINERFYSPDLKMTVYSKRSDPRSGEFTYRMTEIKRSEPDANQFRIPSGYTEIEGKSR
ncbi:MAG: hypothetical protein ACRCWJ_23585 [Casimicrobium sp.]